MNIYRRMHEVRNSLKYGKMKDFRHKERLMDKWYVMLPLALLVVFALWFIIVGVWAIGG